MIVRTVPNALAGLLGRLTDPQDRETYAALISFVGSLPEGDELFRIVELLGLLSLVGQRVPDALAEFLAELRAQTKVAETYRAQVDARLAKLPGEFAAGIDPAAIAREMSERFRQQLQDTGLRDTSALLASSAKDIRALSVEIAAAVKPAAHEYRCIASTLSSETAKLITAACRVEEHNEQLIVQQRSNSWILQVFCALVLFLIGGVCGIFLEQRQASLFNNVSSQIEPLQPAIPIVAMPQKDRKQSGL